MYKWTLIEIGRSWLKYRNYVGLPRYLITQVRII